MNCGWLDFLLLLFQRCHSALESVMLWETCIYGLLFSFPDDLVGWTLYPWIDIKVMALVMCHGSLNHLNFHHRRQLHWVFSNVKSILCEIIDTGDFFFLIQWELRLNFKKCLCQMIHNSSWRQEVVVFAFSSSQHGGTKILLIAFIRGGRLSHRSFIYFYKCFLGKSWLCVLSLMEKNTFVCWTFNTIL